ncbi:MAG: LamG domain-containing protein [Kiritimatiellae bacterium]|nr:LamG domain-containing protein [Kiritimatiellia bacterium]
MSKFIGYSSAMALSFAALAFAHADTIAWWHFDECEPGTTAHANTVASDQAQTTYAHVYTVGDSDAMSSLHENSGDYLPTYTKPFRGLVVYDPVTDTTRTNRAAMKFRVDRGGPNPNTNAGRARFGGALKFDGGDDLYSSLYGTSALTVEAFVCTTGGTYYVFAPIVGSVGGTSWTNERWALYMETDGTIAVRLTAGGEPSTAFYSGGTGGRGKSKVNNGAWHHVAFTYDGSKVRIYVDYEIDKKNSNDEDRAIDKTGTIPTYSDNATWVGGYAYGNANNGSRKFPGVIDEVRVSNATLTPDQFLRMQRLDTDDADVARVSFEPDEYGFRQNDYVNLSDNLGPNRNLAVFRRVSDADPSSYDAETKAGTVIAAGKYSDIRAENVASYYQATNAVGKANYIHIPYVSQMIRGGDGAAASYTIETFFKTRGRVTGGESYRQVIFKFGGAPWINVLFDAKTSRKLLYNYYMDGTTDGHYPLSDASNLDDEKWHHVACVVNGTAQTNNISFYLDYRLDRAFTGTLPDVGTGNSMFFGARENGGGQFFDGWLDDIRVTRRALTPDEFLTTHPVGSGDASLLALFENDYTFTCAENEALSVTGVAEARTGGVAPTFVKGSRGTLLLDGTNSTVRAANKYSASFNKSRVVFPENDLYEAESFTVEFWAKFTGIVDANGDVAADSNALAQHAPILRLVRSDSPSNYDWYLFRQSTNSKVIQLAMLNEYPCWTIPNLVVDGRWHHYAFTCQPKTDDDTKTSVQFFYDYGPHSVQTVNARIPYRFDGHRLMVGEGSHNEPNLQFEMDALRFSKGVLDPSRFLGRVPGSGMILVR